MEQLPDAPWIRKAETEGYPFDEPPPVECPICGWECETIYIDRSGTVCGCERCMETRDSWEWDEERREADRYDS
jgi:hypothetical protein